MKALKSFVIIPVALMGLVVPILTWSVLMKVLGYSPSHYLLQAASLWLAVCMVTFVLLSNMFGSAWRRGALLAAIVVVAIYDNEHQQWLEHVICALL